MTRDEMIEQSRRRAEELRADIERRAAERERDPAAMQDWLLADAEPIEAPPVSENELPHIIYRDFDGGALTPGSEPDMPPDFSGWEKWLDGHLAIMRKAILDDVARGTAQATMTLIQRERARFERELAILKNENAEIKGMLTSALMLLGQKETKAADIVELPRGFIRKRTDAA